MKKIFLLLALFSFSHVFASGVYILVATAEYSNKKCEAFILQNEMDNKIWLLTLPHRSIDDTKLKDLNEDKSKFEGQGEIVNLSDHEMTNLKGFRVSFTSVKNSLKYKVHTKGQTLSFSKPFSSLSCK